MKNTFKTMKETQIQMNKMKNKKNTGNKKQYNVPHEIYHRKTT